MQTLTRMPNPQRFPYCLQGGEAEDGEQEEQIGFDISWGSGE